MPSSGEVEIGGSMELTGQLFAELSNSRITEVPRLKPECGE